MLNTRAAKAGPEGRLFGKVTSDSLRKYTDQLTGNKFSQKDFRTLVANKLAMKEINGQEAPTSETAYKKAVRSVAQAVSKALGNTPSVALASYISPAVFGTWRAGLQST